MAVEKMRIEYDEKLGNRESKKKVTEKGKGPNFLFGRRGVSILFSLRRYFGHEFEKGAFP